MKTELDNILCQNRIIKRQATLLADVIVLIVIALMAVLGNLFAATNSEPSLPGATNVAPTIELNPRNLFG